MQSCWENWGILQIKPESGRTVTLCSVCKNVLINAALIKLSDWNLFRVNQIYSDLFRNLYPGQSELTRVNPRLPIRMNLRSEWFKLQSRSESFRTIPTSIFLFVHKHFKKKSYVYVLQYLWYRYRSAILEGMLQVSTDYYSMLPHLGNIRRKPRVTRHNPSLHTRQENVSSHSYRNVQY